MPASHSGSRSACAAQGVIVNAAASAASGIVHRTQRDRLDFEQQLASANLRFEEKNVDLTRKALLQTLAHLLDRESRPQIHLEEPASPRAHPGRRLRRSVHRRQIADGLFQLCIALAGMLALMADDTRRAGNIKL